ncbi:DUF317 domain-containing protein [Streptomyces decoyicus]|uniref:DUF317 domain-containing protein n=1 Tax=Streptomyces decoyicus TaxID=249567 RepID=UPI0033C3C93E
MTTAVTVWEDFDVPAHESAWAVAAYETPVSDHMWHLTVTGATPAPVLQELLDHLAGDGWDIAVGSALDEKSVTAATRPLVEAGWKHGIDGAGCAGRTCPRTRGFNSTPALKRPSSLLATPGGSPQVSTLVTEGDPPVRDLDVDVSLGERIETGRLQHEHSLCDLPAGHPEDSCGALPLFHRRHNRSRRATTTLCSQRT